MLFFYICDIIKLQIGGERLMIHLEKLETEQVNDRTRYIDSGSCLEIVEMINNEDKLVALAVEKEKVAIAALMEAAVAALRKDGRIIYVGAGTSGRLGVLDASECPPTYGVSPDRVIGVIAGGREAMFEAQEGAEDSKILARKDLEELKLTDRDIVIGLAASGRTPYVIGALEYAHEVGAVTGAVSCVSNSEIGKLAKFPVSVITGGEVITGSTRMKAGTAQKMVLNMISTGCMIRLGKVYGNLMIDVKPTNDKLVMRAKNIIQKVVQCDLNRARELFEQSDQQVKVAIVMGLEKINKREAMNLLQEKQGRIVDVLEFIQNGATHE